MKTIVDLIKLLSQRPVHEVFSYKSQYRTFRYSSHDAFVMIQKTAALLRKQGVGEGDRVLLWGPNSPSWAIAFLGCIWCGAVAVPVDNRQTREFVQKIQAQVRAKVIFISRFKQLPGARIHKVLLEELEEILFEMKQQPAAPVAPEDLAQILYTSGTTGDPKGVMLSHKNIMANVQSLLSLRIVSSGFSFLSVLPLSHVFEQAVGLFVPLAAGARVVYTHTLKSSTLLSLLRAESISFMVVVPQLLQVFREGAYRYASEQAKDLDYAIALGQKIPLLRALFFRQLRKDFGPKFQYFFVGGAPLPEELETFWQNVGFTLLQGYGLSETSPVLTCNTPESHEFGSVGRAISGVELKIANDGEILAKGESVFSGYYKSAVKTAASFDNGWFRTGDAGLIDGKGFLFLKGRKKEIIVTPAGVKVYPEDIEQVLNRIAGVKDGCVIGVESKAGEQVQAVLLLKRGIRAKSVVQSANASLDSSQQIRSYHIWPFEDFPRTTTLKVRKFVVRQWLEGRQVLSLQRPVRETRLYNVLARVTPVTKKIRPKATLGIDLKLSSIDRVELAVLLEQEFSIDIDENLLTTSLTVRSLEKLIEQQHKRKSRLQTRKWPFWWPVRALRFVSQWLFVFPLVRLFARTTVSGLENLKDVQGPVVFAPNHASHFDAPTVLSSLPLRFSTRTAVATWAEYFDLKPRDFFKNIYIWLALRFVWLALNSYLLPRTFAVRQSLEYTGSLLDSNWNVMFFPEGARTITGQILPFEQGIGLIATQMQVSVVPVRIRGSLEVLPRDRFWPRVGSVTVAFGKPLRFSATASVVEATGAVESAVKKL